MKTYNDILGMSAKRLFRALHDIDWAM